MRTQTLANISKITSVIAICGIAAIVLTGAAKKNNHFKSTTVRQQQKSQVLFKNAKAKQVFDWTFDGYWTQGGDNTAINWGNSNVNVVGTNQTEAFVNTPCSGCSVTWSQETTGSFGFFNYGTSGLMTIQLNQGQIAEFLCTISDSTTTQSMEAVFSAQ